MKLLATLLACGALALLASGCAEELGDAPPASVEDVVVEPTPEAEAAEVEEWAEDIAEETDEPAEVEERLETSAYPLTDTDPESGVTSSPVPDAPVVEE